MSRDPNCVFCKIVAVEIPAQVVYENEFMLAFLDTGPLADGHLLVIPREHLALLTDLSPAQVGRLVGILPMLGRALLDVTGAEGFNVLLNQGPSAGQVVPHLHFHLIPRRSADGLGYRWKAGTYAKGRAGELAAAYQQALSRPPS